MVLPPDWQYFLISAVILMCFPVGLVWFWMRGFFGAFLKVKASGGSKVMVRLRYPTHWRFIPGVIHDGFVVFKDGDTKKRVSVNPEAFYTMIKIWWVDVHPESGAVYLPSGDIDYSHDPAKVESLYVRAIMASNVKDIKMIYVFLLLFLLVLLLAGALYLSFQNNTLLTGMQAGVV